MRNITSMKKRRKKKMRRMIVPIAMKKSRNLMNQKEVEEKIKLNLLKKQIITNKNNKLHLFLQIKTAPDKFR